MREKDRAGVRAFAAAPLGPFLRRQLLWALGGGLLGYLIGGWDSALVLFVGWGLAALPIRWWARRRYLGPDRQPPRRS